jgi:hypothetical protein
MPTTGEVWPSLYTGNSDHIRKWLYGSVLIRDWKADGSTSLADFNPFADDGQLRTDFFEDSFPGGRWYEVGAITEDGVEFNPKFSTDETKIWQSRQSQRTDVTEDDEEVMFTCSESTPLVDYLRNNLPLTNVPEIGTEGYQVTKPNFSDIVQRQILVIGVDGSIGEGGQAIYLVEARPRVSLTKVGKRTFAAKKVDGSELTYGVYPDPNSGFPRRTYRGGPVWLSEGGLITFATPNTVTATATSAGEATISFTQPTSHNDPFAYTVTKNDGSTTTPATIVGSPTLVGDTVTVTVSGLTAASSYTFVVSVTGSNDATASYPASNSITAT